ncbi:hypothetical protein JRQ81_009861 [Phrynocephalus forsythii]|uniref:Uncharacterized protein n=1 Tax=Phrynocephalus forsythii TaxID=171643 RepID=A0A9Q0X8Z1_9SAUR|nr:hypothetical protein JRQ81_009861 [Phrynocephalus forsythii]
MSADDAVPLDRTLWLRPHNGAELAQCSGRNRSGKVRQEDNGKESTAVKADGSKEGDGAVRFQPKKLLDVFCTRHLSQPVATNRLCYKETHTASNQDFTFGTGEGGQAGPPIS